ncbi:MAG: glycosyl transferase [Cycloclasticus sp. symbiont of Poecilosclerida sp. M]|nr:MAG: glycosyl transferase [Cycloclasticus sp. symbiont of Poecilosclerida sp. M]
MKKSHDIAFLIPCFNEEVAITKVVNNCKETIPEAKVYVFDNNSTDKTIGLAKQAGAIVKQEHTQGKGNVVRRMFADIDADIYILCDGDMTYDIASAPKMINKLVQECQDMVVATRVSDRTSEQTYPMGHVFGNKALTGIVGLLFGNCFSDILSGYRVFSRRFVKSFPAISRGFEIETELTIHALELRMPVSEIKTPYYARPIDSESKLSTFKDGSRILMVIIFLLKEVRPLLFFGSIFLLLSLIAIVLSYPLFITYIDTGLVPRFPTAILASGTMILAFLSLACGAILDSVSRGRREVKRMHYLSIKPLDTH